MALVARVQGQSTAGVTTVSTGAELCKVWLPAADWYRIIDVLEDRGRRRKYWYLDMLAGAIRVQLELDLHEKGQDPG